MSQMMQPTRQEDGNLQIQRQNLRRLAFLTGALSLAPAAFYIYLSISQRVWQYFILTAFFLLVVPACGWVLRLAREEGKHIQASWTLIGTVFAAALGANAIIANIGSAMGTVVLVIAVFIAIQTLPPRFFARVLVAGALVILLLAAFDALASYPRITSEGLVRFSAFIIITVIVAFLVLAFTQFANLTLTNKILVTYLGIATLISLAFTYAAGAIFSSVLTERAGQNLHLVAQSRGQALGSILEQQLDAVTALSTDEDIQLQIARANRAHNSDPQKETERIKRLDALWRQADAADNNEHPVVNGRLYNVAASRLQEFQKSFPDHAELLVTDSLGSIVATTHRVPAYYQGDQVWWQTAYNNGNGGVYIGVPEYDETVKSNIIRLAVPVRDAKTGALIGVLQTGYATSAFQRLFSQVGQTGQTEYIFLGEPAVRLRAGEIQPVPPELKGVLEDLPQSGYQEVTLDQTSNILSAAPVTSLTGKVAIDNLPLKAIVYQTTAETQAPVQQQVRIIHLLGTLFSAIVTFLAVLVARQLSKPILDLTQAIEQFKSGNLEAQASTTSSDEIGYLATTFNELTAQIRQILASLEQRVAERTIELEQAVRKTQERARALELVSEVAKVAASQQQIESLLTTVTTLASEKFSFYHVGIFLLDENREYAVLRAANSPGGKRMLQRQHRLRVGQVGIVGKVAETGQPRIALDVGQDAVYFDNPDLPNTRSEAALPLRAGEEIIGVLDVQSTEANAFTEDDIQILNILADQVAIAIDNARLVTDLQQALMEAKTLQQQYLLQSWKNLGTRKHLGYHRTLIEGKPISQPIQRAEIIQALKSGKFVTIYPQDTKSHDETNLPALAIPIRLREQVIGVLNIRSQNPARRWREEEISLLSSIADRLALALENARLFEETTRRALRERTVSEITTKIRSKTDPEGMIQTALAELQQVLGVSHVEILPYQPEAPATGTKSK